MTLFHALMSVKADRGSPEVGAWGGRRALDLGASVESSHLMPVAGVHFCQESGEMQELCALARRAVETNGTGGKFTGKGVCTKHLEAFQAFFEVGTGRYWGKNCGLEMYFQLFLK